MWGLTLKGVDPSSSVPTGAVRGHGHRGGVLAGKPPAFAVWPPTRLAGCGLVLLFCLEILAITPPTVAGVAH